MLCIFLNVKGAQRRLLEYGENLKWNFIVVTVICDHRFHPPLCFLFMFFRQGEGREG
uniref:Uncharacterized protein n=1 Tax=Anguilla anguilla TaxID=7936 RepID=A0A0E9RSJ3_ANGAN